MVKEAQNFSFKELNVPDEVREMLKKMFAPLLFLTVFRADVKSDILDDDLSWAYAFSMSSNTMPDPGENEERILEFGRRCFHNEMCRILGRNLDDYGAWIRTAVIDAGYIIPNIEILSLRKEKARNILLNKGKLDNIESFYLYEDRGANMPVYRREEIKANLEEFNSSYEKFTYDEEMLDKADKFFKKVLFPDEYKLLTSYIYNDYVATCIFHRGADDTCRFGLSKDDVFAPEYHIGKNEYDILKTAAWNIFMISRGDIVPAVFEEFKQTLS